MRDVKGVIKKKEIAYIFMVHIYLCNVLQNHSYRPAVFKNGGTVTLKSNAHLMSR